MILVNVRKSAESAATPEQIMTAAAGDWAVAESALEAYGDVLLAVRRNVVLGAFDITNWEEVEGGRYRFDLEPSEVYAALVGQASPLLWKRGQVNPVAYLATSDVTPSVDHLPPTATHTTHALSKPRRRLHRITIETKGLSDQEAAKLHYALTIVAKATGKLWDYSSTSLVREFREAQEDLELRYQSAPSPRAIP